MLLCDRFTSLNPFIIREQDAEEVITLINRFNNYGNKDNDKISNAQYITNTTKRKKVYADTATGGWY